MPVEATKRVRVNAEKLLSATAKSAREFKITEPQVLVEKLLDSYLRRPSPGELPLGGAATGSATKAAATEPQPTPLTAQDLRVQDSVRRALDAEAGRGVVGSFDPDKEG